ncbi:hypothetical protein FQN57_000170 [Myotisia sp. PD_48]|nr:hypothetical protein FQN57_000170 [Myotisia sp. PD_48]
MGSHTPQVSPSDDFQSREYDYIIIGGGTAGLAVATRLSERSDLKIAIIEAGPAAPDEPLINDPRRFGQSLGTKYDWQFETVAQEALAGRKLSWGRGKVLGGSSALNFMAWNRANKEDYDAWEELGNKNWGWDSLLPFFKKTETFIKPTAGDKEKYAYNYEPDFHGFDGPIQTCFIPDVTPSSKYWHSTVNNLGIKSSPGNHSGSNAGAWTTVAAVDQKQTRSYAFSAYYLPVANRPNLFLLTEALVQRVILDQKDTQWRATGVQFTHKGIVSSIKASKEVIVSAGSIQSPQILELSGIGNPRVLDAAGIAVKVSNPNVGENLQDHFMMATVHELAPSIAADGTNVTFGKPNSSSEGDMLGATMTYCCIEDIASPEELLKIRSKIELGKNIPDDLRFQICARKFLPGQKLGQLEYLMVDGNWSQDFESVPGKSYITLLQMLQYPLSRGSIHIPPQKFDGLPSTAEDTLVINPRYYLGTGVVDVDVMQLGLKFGDKICSTKPLSDVIASRAFPAEDSDGSDVFKDYHMYSTVTDWHPVGTCAMGGFEGEKKGVVDDRLRVYGVQGLRVIDASIMPLHISAHLQATVYAIAEKGASMILEDLTLIK